jgi:hypothetical protein
MPIFVACSPDRNSLSLQAAECLHFAMRALSQNGDWSCAHGGEA